MLSAILRHRRALLTAFFIPLLQVMLQEFKGKVVYAVNIASVSVCSNEPQPPNTEALLTVRVWLITER